MITINFSDCFCTITLDRVSKHNAFTYDMYTQIVDSFHKSLKSNKIKAIIFRANGEYFSSGHDVNDFIRNDTITFNKDHPLLAFLGFLENFSKLIICVVDGHAIGIGATMLLHADFIIAQKSLTLSTPFINMGLCAEAGSSQLLERIIGKPLAREMLLFGRTVKTDRLLGTLINELTASRTQSDAMLKILKKQIIDLPMSGILKNKELMRYRHEPLTQTMEREMRSFSHLLRSPETQRLIHKKITENKRKTANNKASSQR